LHHLHQAGGFGHGDSIHTLADSFCQQIFAKQAFQQFRKPNAYT